MSLNNVDSSNGYLESLAEGGEAVSKKIYQENGTNINISTTADTGVTAAQILTQGDTVFIEKADLSTYQFTVGPISEVPGPNGEVSTIHTNWSTNGYSITKYEEFTNNYYPFWKAMNGNNNTDFTDCGQLVGPAANQWIIYTFPAATIVRGVRMNGYQSQLTASHCTSAKVYIWNGTSYDLLHTEIFGTTWSIGEIREFSFSNDTASTKYRVEFTTNDDGVFATSYFAFDGPVGVSYGFDTSAITQGEIPNAIYTTAGGYQKDFTGVRDISVDIEFANISESLVGGTTEYRRLPDSGGADTVTVSSEWLPYYPGTRTFDGIDRLPGEYNWGMDYTYDEEWIILHIEVAKAFTGMRMETDSYATYNYPTEFWVEGSNDGTNFIELNHVIGEIWVDDSSFTYSWTNTTEYLHYRIRLNTSGRTRAAWGEVYFREDIPSDTDLLKTSFPISDGDNLVIVKADNSIHSIVASGVTGSGPFELNTAEVTGGEVPTRVYRLNDSMFINNIELQNPVDQLSVVTDLKSTRTYDKVVSVGRTIETKAVLSKGNKVIEISGNIYKLS